MQYLTPDIQRVDLYQDQPSICAPIKNTMAITLSMAVRGSANFNHLSYFTPAIPQMPIIRAPVGKIGFSYGLTEAVSGNRHLTGDSHNIGKRGHKRHYDVSVAGRG